jgi:ribosome biogenesis protein MAK21
MENLYKLVHQSQNTKIKIQTCLFIFQILQAQNQLSDRYYRLLYGLLLEEGVFATSLNEVFFDLIFFSLKEDQNLNRVRAFVKRLL